MRNSDSLNRAYNLSGSFFHLNSCFLLLHDQHFVGCPKAQAMRFRILIKYRKTERLVADKNKILVLEL